MGDKDLDSIPNDVEKATYSVIAYPGNALPPQYKNMIFSKWMRSLRYGNDYFKLVSSDQYYWAYQRYIEMLLNKVDAVIRLAVLTDEPDTVLGWSLIRGEKLDYVWVDAMQRNKGIATSLVPTKINIITHYTKSGASIWNKKLSHAIFNPF